MTKRPYTSPTLRQLSFGDLTEDQRAWIESTRANAHRWTVAEIAGLVGAAVLALGAVALCVFVLSFVTGCGVSDAIYVDERFTVAEQAEIAKAAAYWCDATAGAACVDLVFGAHVNAGKASHVGGRVLVRATEAEALRSNSPTLHDPSRTGVRWIDYDDLGIRQGETIVVVPSRIAVGFFRTAVAHELGHHFDMNHIAAPGALMAPDFGPVAAAHVGAECLTAADVAELCNSHDCGQPKECEP